MLEQITRASVEKLRYEKHNNLMNGYDELNGTENY
jgi:hypothetical protein